jgi:membrane carboxypeptidase/penicillin-binding protein
MVRRLSLILSFTIFLIGAYQWLYFPSEKSFPYSIILPCLLFPIILLSRILKFKINLKFKYLIFSMMGIVVISTLIMYFWAASKINILPKQNHVNVSQEFREASVSMEDGYFYQHNGFDFEAMHRALRCNVQSGQIKQGGSTITQQTAKNLFLSGKRTLWRKIQEAFLTITLEQHFTKDEILNLYVNTIDYGLGQHGIQNASKYYFNTTPDKLTLTQSSILVGIVPNPPKDCIDIKQMEKRRQVAITRADYYFPTSHTKMEIETARKASLQSVISVNHNEYCRRQE